MRTRRQVIMAGGTAVTVLVSGCLEEVPEEEDDGETQNGETQDGEDGNETDTNGEDGGAGVEDGENEDGMQDGEGDEDEPEPAAFEVSSVESPETVEIGTSFEWSLTVENTGGEDGTFETVVSVQTPGGEESTSTVSVDVPAGETEDTVLSFRPDYIGEYLVTVEETGDEFGIRAVERSLTIGETYTTPDGVRLTLDTREIGSDIQPIQSYSYTSEEGRRIHRAGPEEKFAVLTVTARNPTREPRELPTYDEFVMVVNEDAEYESTERLARDAYTGGTSRVSREGVVLFEIADRFDRGDDYQIYWTRATPEGTAEAVWSTPDD